MKLQHQQKPGEVGSAENPLLGTICQDARAGAKQNGAQAILPPRKSNMAKEDSHPSLQVLDRGVLSCHSYPWATGGQRNRRALTTCSARHHVASLLAPKGALSPGPSTDHPGPPWSPAHRTGEEGCSRHTPCVDKGDWTEGRPFCSTCRPHSKDLFWAGERRDPQSPAVL